MINIVFIILIAVIMKKFHVFSLVYWVYVDLIRHIKESKKGNKKPHYFGIYGFFGLPGKGKTMAMTYKLSQLRKKHGDDILIFTNYGFKDEDKPFSHWQMLLQEYDKPAIFAWDEVQNEFNSRDYKSFPVSLLTLLTQNRKGNGKRIYYSAQRFSRVDKVFRELSFECSECKTYFGRLTFVKWFDWEDYEMYVNTANVNTKMKIRPLRTERFIQTDELRNQYDSYQMLETAKSKQYMSRDEISKINS